MNGTEFVILIILVVGYLLSKGYKNDPLNFFSKLTGWILSIVGFILPFLIAFAFIDTGSKLLNCLCVMGVFVIEIVIFCLIIGSKTVQKGFKDRREEAIDSWRENFLKIGKEVAREEIEYFLNKSPVIKANSDGTIDIRKVYDWLCRERSIELDLILIDNKDKFNKMLGADVESLPPLPFDGWTSRVNGQKPGRDEGGANYNKDQFAKDYILSKTGLQYLKNYYGSTTSRYFINRESDYYKECVKYIKECEKDQQSNSIEAETICGE